MATDYVGRHMAKKAASKVLKRRLVSEMVFAQVKAAEADRRGEMKLRAAEFLIGKLS